MPRLILTLVILGLVIYFLVRFAQGRGHGSGGNGGGGGPGGGGSGRSPRSPRQLAPDDDPGFLRDLDDKLWHDRHGKGDAE